MHDHYRAGSVTTTEAFDRGAGHYDLMVALNPGYHRELRRAAGALIERVGDGRGLSLIDLACGSGASTRALWARPRWTPRSWGSTRPAACWPRRAPRSGRPG